MTTLNPEWLWDQLLDYIQADLVVPIVGRDLLWIEKDGRRQYVPELAARQLAVRAGLTWNDHPVNDPLAFVVQQILAKQGSGRDWPYTALDRIAKSLSSDSVPPAFTALARLPFRLFVSSTWDSFLERAIDAVRFDGQAVTIVPPYGLGSKVDLPDRRSAVPVVFPLLGRANPSTDYALTDEDVLEFVHRFQRTGTPQRLLQTLQGRHVLLIGGGFSDWLLRFLLRLVRPERVWTHGSNHRMHFIADPRVAEDPQLLEFLRHPLSGTNVFHVNRSDDFVDELSHRWYTRHGESVQPGPNGIQESAISDAPVSRGVFLSYASEDYVAARRIRDRLDTAGLDVWFDRRDLHAGDEFEAKIVKQIGGSHLFIALISRHSLTTAPRFFRLEWREAERRAKFAAYDLPFVLPVALDDTDQDADGIPAFIARVEWTRAVGGDLPQSFIDDIVRAYKRIQRPIRA